ncbi:DUF11 domain-containing protein, partial [Candidatus Peregrinibacteria bacterium]|nr:DUF11 domain-containing protein [Candidatus Peregrinibacteria bacterium]
VANGTNTIVCNNTTLTPGQSKDFHVTLKVKSDQQSLCGKSMSNTAHVEMDNGLQDTNLANNDSTVPIPVVCPPPTFTISKTDNRTTIRPGDRDTYEITVTNTSPFAASATLNDQFPANQLAFQSASNGGRFDGSTITWNNLNFQPRETKTLTVQAQAHTDLMDGMVILNAVQVVNHGQERRTVNSDKHRRYRRSPIRSQFPRE